MSFQIGAAGFQTVVGLQPWSDHQFDHLRDQKQFVHCIATFDALLCGRRVQEYG